MARAKKRVATSERDTSEGHYKKVEELPEERRKAYESILEDFDKQGKFLKLLWKSVNVISSRQCI